MQESLVQQIVEEVMQQVLKAQNVPQPDGQIPVGVSARHVHLAQLDVELLFGKGYQLTPKFELSQPGQFAAEETLIIAGPKGAIEKVRILGPTRETSQVEISWTDAIKMGLTPPLRISGDIKGSGSITLIGTKGSVLLQEGCIIAQAHIHMSPQDAVKLRLKDGQSIQVTVKGIRPITLSNVIVRISERYNLEMHIDTDEANAALIQQGACAEIVSVESSQAHSPIHVVENKSAYIFEKKLLSQADIDTIHEEEIIISKKTIVTALAYDKLRELNKILTIRT